MLARPGQPNPAGLVGLVVSRMTGGGTGSPSCLSECLQDGTADMGLCCAGKTSSPFLARGDELYSKDRGICFMIPRCQWPWRHACSEPCFKPTRKHTPLHVYASVYLGDSVLISKAPFLSFRLTKVRVLETAVLKYSSTKIA